MAETAAPLTAQITLTPSERDRVFRWNFVFFLADYVLFSVAFRLLSPSTVIPDFTRKLTDSEVLIAFSGQWFQIGWLLPQLLIARSLVRVERKKWWFVGPNIPVRTLLLIFAGVITLLGPDQRAAMLALFLLFYGLAALGDGVVGVPWMDLAGSSLDDRRRARLFGWGEALVGLSVLGLAPFIRLVLGNNGPDFPNNYALLFAVAGIAFLLSVPVGIFIRELPGGQARETAPPLREYLPDLLRVVRGDRPFRAMIVARVLVTLFTLAGPFYIGLATEELGLSSDVAVSNLLLLQTLGGVIGALLYARFGDRRTVEFIRIAMFLALLHPALALAASRVGPGPLYLGFLMIGVVEGTLGMGFINWVIMYATPDQRPVYSGLFNSVSAVGLLAAPFLGGGLVELFGYEAAFIAALLAMAAALYVALRYIRSPRPAQV